MRNRKQPRNPAGKWTRGAGTSIQALGLILGLPVGAVLAAYGQHELGIEAMRQWAAYAGIGTIVFLLGMWVASPSSVIPD